MKGQPKRETSFQRCPLAKRDEGRFGLQPPKVKVWQALALACLTLAPIASFADGNVQCAYTSYNYQVGGLPTGGFYQPESAPGSTSNSNRWGAPNGSIVAVHWDTSTPGAPGVIEAVFAANGEYWDHVMLSLGTARYGFGAMNEMPADGQNGGNENCLVYGRDTGTPSPYNCWGSGKILGFLPDPLAASLPDPLIDGASIASGGTYVDAHQRPMFGGATMITQAALASYLGGDFTSINGTNVAGYSNGTYGSQSASRGALASIYHNGDGPCVPYDYTVCSRGYCHTVYSWYCGSGRGAAIANLVSNATAGNWGGLNKGVVNQTSTNPSNYAWYQPYHMGNSDTVYKIGVMTGVPQKPNSPGQLYGIGYNIGEFTDTQANVGTTNWNSGNWNTDGPNGGPVQSPPENYNQRDMACSTFISWLNHMTRVSGTYNPSGGYYPANEYTSTYPTWDDIQKPVYSATGTQNGIFIGWNAAYTAAAKPMMEAGGYVALAVNNSWGLDFPAPYPWTTAEVGVLGSGVQIALGHWNNGPNMQDCIGSNPCPQTSAPAQAFITNGIDYGGVNGAGQFPNSYIDNNGYFYVYFPHYANYYLMSTVGYYPLSPIQDQMQFGRYTSLGALLGMAVAAADQFTNCMVAGAVNDPALCYSRWGGTGASTGYWANQSWANNAGRSTTPGNYPYWLDYAFGTYESSYGNSGYGRPYLPKTGGSPISTSYLLGELTNTGPSSFSDIAGPWAYDVDNQLTWSNDGTAGSWTCYY
jgi:hypothetical protein